MSKVQYSVCYVFQIEKWVKNIDFQIETVDTTTLSKSLGSPKDLILVGSPFICFHLTHKLNRSIPIKQQLQRIEKFAPNTEAHDFVSQITDKQANIASGND